MSNLPSALPPGAAPAVRYLWRLTQWVVARPFLLRRRAWGVLAVLAAVATGGVLLIGAPFWIPAIPAVPALTLLVAVGNLRRLARTEEGRDLVVLSLFAGETTPAVEASLDHVRGLEDRMRENPVLGPRTAVKVVRASMTEHQAIQLLEETRALVVLFGKVRATQQTTRIEGSIVVRWMHDTAPTFHLAEDGQVTFEPKSRPGPFRSEHLPLDADLPRAAAMARRFEANHADAAEGTTLVALAEHSLEREDSPTAEAAVSEAAGFRGAVSVRARACLEIAQQGLRMQNRIGKHPDATKSQRETWLRSDMNRLEQAALGDADHADLWSEIALLAFIGKLLGLDTRHTRLRAEKRAVALEPDVVSHRYGLGHAYRNVGSHSEALKQFQLATGSDSKKVAADAYIGIGAVKLDQGQPEAACDDFERAVMLGGGLRATRCLGYAEVRARRHLRAERNLRKILRATPDDTEARAWFQESLNDRGRDFEPSRLCNAAAWVITVPGLAGLGVLGLRLAHWRNPENLLAVHLLADADLVRGRLALPHEFFRWLSSQEGSGGLRHGAFIEGRKALTAALDGRQGEADHTLKRLRHAYDRKELGPEERTDEDLYRAVLGPFDAKPETLRGLAHGESYFAIADAHFGDLVPRLHRLAP